MYVQLLELKIGNKVRLHDGSIVEIIENPGDGIWVETCPTESKGNESAQKMTHCQEIKEVVS